MTFMGTDRWRTMKIEEIEYSADLQKVRLILTTGGYRGEYGQYTEDRISVVLDVNPDW